MANYKIKCEVIEVKNGKSQCLGSSKMEKGQEFIIGGKTPEGMCARVFPLVYPAALAMRFSESIPWEQGRGYFDITCPDVDVVFRLSRIK